MAVIAKDGAVKLRYATRRKASVELCKYGAFMPGNFKAVHAYFTNLNDAYPGQLTTKPVALGACKQLRAGRGRGGRTDDIVPDGWQEQRKGKEARRRCFPPLHPQPLGLLHLDGRLGQWRREALDTGAAKAT